MHTNTQEHTKGAQRAMLASLVGTTLEWYEFFIFGIAATLVFGKLFYPSYDPLVGTLLSLSTFSVAFVIRPIGAIVCGHLGDKYGRKNVLVGTLLAMGGATFLIGILPTYESVGILAPILLILLRIVQGFSLGGEFSGAVLMSIEHAGPEKRGFAGSLVNLGIPLGLILANSVYFIVSMLGDKDFMSWGWRVPFLISIILIAVGMFIRLRVSESPEFAELRKRAALTETPFKEVVVHHWKIVALLAFAYVGAGTTFYTSSMFVVAYCEQFLSMPRTSILGMLPIAFAYLGLTIIAFGWLSDKIDRKILLIISYAVSIPAIFIWFSILGGKSMGSSLLAFGVFFIPHGLCLAVIPTFFAEVFPHKVRYSGMAMGYTLGTIIGSAASPIISTYLLKETRSFVAVGIYISITCIISMVAVYLLKPVPETQTTRDGPADGIVTSAK